MTIKKCKPNSGFLKLSCTFFASLFVSFQSYAESNINVVHEQINPSEQSINQDQITLQGTVVDATTNEALIGVSIMDKNNPKNGAATDIDGHFTLTVSSNAILVIKYVGYHTTEVEVKNQKNINVLLKEDVQILQDVVVVGYTTQKKADLTGAVASVRMDDINDVASTSISDALQGRMSGVTILQNSGAPGSGTAIHVRGIGTFGNKEPLYVIDGVPSESMNDLSPSDIERVDVLKDASSSAIYGSRAANGVVLIQTKKGSRDNTKINVSFNTYHGFSSPTNKIKVLNAADRNMIHKEAYTNALNDGAMSQKDYDVATSVYNDPSMQKSLTNWQDEIFKNGAYQGNYDLSLTGGSKSAVYSVMLGHLTQDGTLKETSFDRTTFRVNSEFELFKGFKLGENLMVSHSKQKVVLDTRAITSALQADPSVPVMDEGEGYYSGSGLLGPDIENPVGIVERSDRTRTRNRVFGNVYAEYTFLNDFKIKTDFGYDKTDWDDNWFTPKVLEAGRRDLENALMIYKVDESKWMNTTTLSYDKTIDKHKLMVIAGHAYESYQQKDFDAKGAGFLSEDKSARYLSAATKTLWALGNKYEYAIDSWLGRLDYSYDSKYLFSASFRADGSSRFQKGNRWGYFPSFSAGWRISEEAFFAGLKPYVENLKLRGSWGKLGNQNLSNSNSPYYPTYPLYANTNDDDGYYVAFGKGEDASIGRYNSTIANPNLKWEITTQYDVGLDISFLDKFEVGFDFYSKDSKDVLVAIPISSLAGIPGNQQVVNAAKVRNSGLEFNASYNTKFSNGLEMRVYGNFATVKNEVRSLGGGSPFSLTSYRGTNINRVQEGEPLAFLYGYKTDGIFRSQAEVDNYTNSKGEVYQPKAKPGDLKFVDVNGDGSISGDDRTKIGSGFPKITYGFGLDFNYKGFDLNMFFQGVGGSDIFNALRYEGMFVNPKYNQFQDILGRYDAVSNPNGNLPRVTTKDQNSNSRFSDYYVESGSYLRMKTLTLGYTFDKKLTSKIGLKKLRLYTTVQNLFTITDYSGYDPDLGNSFSNDIKNNNTEIGVDRGQLPQPKTFIIGLNINF